MARLLDGLGISLGLGGASPTPTPTPSLSLRPSPAPSPVAVVSALTGQKPIKLGPLTTIFTPPATCTIAVADGASAWLAQTCAGANPIDAAACWPPATANAPAPSPPLKGWGFYSPGIACPARHAAACTATGGGASGWPVQFNLEAGETAVGCCPDGFACANVNGQTCIRIATSTAVPTAQCRGGAMTALGSMTLPDSPARVTALSIFAPMIQLNFHASDLAPAPTPPSPPTSGVDQLTLAPGAPSETGLLLPGSGAPGDTSAPPADAPSSTGIPVGAMVGVGVAGGLGLLAVLVGGCWFWQRRLRRQRDGRDEALRTLDGMYEAARPVGLGSDEYARYFVQPGRRPGVAAEEEGWPPGMGGGPVGGRVSAELPPVPAGAGRVYQPYRPPGYGAGYGAGV